LGDDPLSVPILPFNPSVTLTVFDVLMKVSDILDPVVVSSTTGTGPNTIPLTMVSSAVTSWAGTATGKAVAIFLNFLCRYLLLLRSQEDAVVSIDLEVLEDE
jgi:hypothetical protein